MNRPRDIDPIAEAQTDAYLRRSSMTFLECAINLMVSHIPIEEVADILEQQAQILRDWR